MSNPEQTSKLVNVRLNGKDYYIRYKDLKDHEEAIIEDNIYYGHMHGYSNKEIDDYITGAKAELRELKKLIRESPDIILTIDRTSERFVPLSDKNDGSNNCFTFDLKLINKE